ncbi:hypothetical protein DFH08DRAFT_897427 [Mycena albidolilacea]|uniref:Uncharacterized protein n=1 Tax=Mycena albidolilacea TaxID=1033008 RepID=A0AAD7ED15_9AGAR|nr:hypothetical protein DFH08DRAFT_897427 [Mycena albidolilacea]
MRLTTLTLGFSVLTAASASVLPSDPFTGRRDLDALFAGQTQPQLPTNLTNAQLGSSYQSQCSVASSAVGQNTIQADIAGATTNWQLINTQMALTKAFDVPICSAPTPSIGPAWASITQTWINILWTSRTTALNTAAYATEFTTEIMPLVANLTGPIPISLSQEVLANYSAMANSLEAAAQATANAFTGLTNSLDAFYALDAECLAIIKANPSKYPPILRRQASQITTLQAQIAVYNTELSALGAAIKTTALGTSTGVGLFPQFAPGVLVPGLSALAEDATAYNTIAANLATAQSQLRQAMARLALSDQLTENMSQQVESFTSIWNAVRSDCDEVSQYIGYAEAFSFIPQVFWATMNNVTCVYETMAIGLQNYANGIASSGIPPSRRDLGGSTDFAATLHSDVQALVSVARSRAKTHQH